MKKDLVSILIPCYNGRRYIEECFLSILNQTYQNIEVIFVDDGSVDDSFNIAMQFVPRFFEKGMLLRCFKKDNGGAASAIQLALKQLQGEFFELFDVDDYLYPENIKSKKEYMDKHPDCALVRSEGEIFSVEQNKVISEYSVRESEKQEYNIFRELIFGLTYNWAGAYLVRTEAFFKVNNGSDIIISKYGQNMQILLPLAYKYECAYVPEVLARYNEYPVSVSHQNIYSKNLELLTGYEDIRLQVLAQMGINNHDLISEINRFYNKKRMDLAIRFQKKDDIKKYYKLLPKSPKLTLLYVSATNPLVRKVYIWMGQNKTKLKKIRS